MDPHIPITQLRKPINNITDFLVKRQKLDFVLGFRGTEIAARKITIYPTTSKVNLLATGEQL